MHTAYCRPSKEGPFDEPTRMYSRRVCNRLYALLRVTFINLADSGAELII